MTERRRSNGTRDGRSAAEVTQAERFGVWLRREAERRNYSIRRLAQLSGLGFTTVQQYVNGSFMPKAASISALAVGLGVPDAVVWDAAGMIPPGRESLDDVTASRRHLRRLVDEIREARVPYAVKILEAFVAADDGDERVARQNQVSSDAFPDPAG